MIRKHRPTWSAIRLAIFGCGKVPSRDAIAHHVFAPHYSMAVAIGPKRRSQGLLLPGTSCRMPHYPPYETQGEKMSSLREFATPNELQGYAEKKGSVVVTADISARQCQLSPDQYEIVGLRTPKGMVPKMLVPKAVLKSVWKREAPFFEALMINRQAEKRKTPNGRSRRP